MCLANQSKKDTPTDKHLQTLSLFFCQDLLETRSNPSPYWLSFIIQSSNDSVADFAYMALFQYIIFPTSKHPPPLIDRNYISRFLSVLRFVVDQLSRGILSKSEYKSVQSQSDYANEVQYHMSYHSATIVRDIIHVVLS